MLYKSNKNKNKSINCKCNENLTVYCPGQEPFAATRNNNIKDRKNRDFVAFSIIIIAHPEINFSGLELLSAQMDSSLLSVITLVAISGQQQRINQAQTG
ncbi:MAG TPA: hypothetical protein VE944_23005 [Nostoc sp.]|uniref:hypothetical protein n=1 Tax=Nostoc sp. TaxID=1180 RepID=UPI002D22DAB8|nr:hypothetical protein [Nostoc sp.]HYX17165.1 hypothetical protein [Nostoc sp.]